MRRQTNRRFGRVSKIRTGYKTHWNIYLRMRWASHFLKATTDLHVRPSGYPPCWLAVGHVILETIFVHSSCPLKAVAGTTAGARLEYLSPVRKAIGDDGRKGSISLCAI